MSKTYRPWNPNQQYLLPPSIQDWLPEDDLVYFMLDTVNELDTSAITQKYEQEEHGYPPYNPRMMVALLLYAYCRGIYSSRKIMAACEQRVSFRVIVAEDIPNCRTVERLLEKAGRRGYVPEKDPCTYLPIWQNCRTGPAILSIPPRPRPQRR